MTPPDKHPAGYRRLLRASRSGHPALTVALARRFLDEHPEYGPAWMLLGVALTDLGCYEEAEEAIETALPLAPAENQAVPLAQMGHLHQARGNFRKAAEWYRRVIEAAPDDAMGYMFLGGVLASEGRLNEAEDAHRAATGCETGSLDAALYNLGLVLRAQGRLIEAAECFERALELTPESRAALRALRDVRRTIGYLREEGGAHSA